MPHSQTRPLVVLSLFLVGCASHGPVAPENVAAPGARVSACEALAQLDAKTMVALAADTAAHGLDVEDPHVGLGICGGASGGVPARSKGGAWILVTRESKVDPDPDFENGGPSVSLTVDLYFVADDGHSVRYPQPFSASGEELGSATIAIESTFDWDDDGFTEVAIVEIQDRPDFHTRRISLYRKKDGAVAPWVPVPGLVEARIEDVDGDGRPDILDDGAFVQDIAAPIFEFSPGYAKLYHALPQGRFASDDATCRAYYQKECPAPVTLADLANIDAEDTSEALRRAMCAGMYGVDPAALVARLDEIYAISFAFLTDRDDASPIPSATLEIPLRLTVSP